MALIANLGFFALSIIVLVVAGSFLVRSLSKIAAFLRLSEFVAGFVIMALATSVPELFVGISSGLAKNSAIILGTIIGSNILDLTIVIGVAILLGRGIALESKSIKRDTIYMFLAASLPLLLMVLGSSISRVDGVILIAAFLAYSYRLYKRSKAFSKEVENKVKRADVVIASIIFVISLVVLFFSAELVVRYASLISVDLGLPLIFIGLFLVAFGTSLPELVFESRAVMTGHDQMALGDLIGSVVMNSTLVIGVTALIHPITANMLLFFTSGIFMIIIAFLFATFVDTGNRLNWKEGVSLILFYIFFVIVEFYIKTLGS